MTWEKKPKKLKAVIAKECNLRMTRDHGLDSSEVANWLLAYQRPLVTNALTDLVCQVMEQRNADEQLQRLLKKKPDQRGHAPIARQMAETLGVPAYYLLVLPKATWGEALHAASVVLQLREHLRPVMDRHPEMTIGEAERLLNAQTAS